MPDPDLICEVRSTDGGVYRDWLGVAVEYTYADTNPLRHFTLTCAEPSSVGKLRLKPGDRVNVTLAGRKVIDNGYVKNRQVGFDPNRHAVQITGISAAGQIQQASVNLGQYRGYSLSQIGGAVAKQFGVGFRMENPPAGADKTFPNVIPHYGETGWAFLRRLARARGVMLRTDPNGDIVAGVPAGGSGATLEEGVNIISLNCYLEFPWAEQIVGSSQTPGTDQKFGSAAAHIQSTATIPSGAKGMIVRIAADRPLDAQENQTAVDAYAQQILLATVQVTVTHRGWFKPGTTDLWELGDKVTVKSPMAFANDSGKMDLRVFTVTCTQSEAGTTTTVVLVSEAVFQRRFPDGNAGDPYNQAATPAKQEVAA